MRKSGQLNKTELKQVRRQQTATIAKVLDSMRHQLPTIQEILDKVWDSYPQHQRLALKPLGRTMPFCDGIGVPKTNLTSTDRQVRALFRQHELKVQTIVTKENSWFVKFDEDSAPDFNTLKQRLRQLSADAHEQLSG